MAVLIKVECMQTHDLAKEPEGAYKDVGCITVCNTQKLETFQYLIREKWINK